MVLPSMPDITNDFRSKLSTVLNSVEEDVASLPFLQNLNCTNISIDPKTVTEALEKLRSNKQDGSQLSSNHLLLAAPVTVLDEFFIDILYSHY